MGVLQNLKIKTKLFLLIAIIVLSTLISGFFYITTITNIENEIESIAQKNLPLVKRVTDIEILQLEQAHQLESVYRMAGVGNASREIQQKIIQDAAISFSNLSEQFNFLINNTKISVDSLLRTGNRSEEFTELNYVYDHLEDISATYRDYKAKTAESISLIEAGNDDAATALIDEIESYQTQLNESVAALLKEIERYNQVSADKVEQDGQDGINRFWFLSIFMLSLSTILAYLIARTISGPVTKLTRQLNNMVETGNLSKRSGNESSDEIGEMSRSVDALVGSVEKTLIKLKNAISTGDFSFDVNRKGDQDILSGSLISIKESYKKIILQAETIALGNFNSTIITPRSEKDELGLALFQMSENLKGLSEIVEAVSNNDYSQRVIIKSEQDTLGMSFNKMTDVLASLTEKNEKYTWITSGLSELNNVMREEKSVEKMAQGIIALLAEHINAQIGAIYIYESSSETLNLLAGYAITSSDNVQKTIALGEGLVGQAALDRKSLIVSEVPEDFWHIRSGAGEKTPTHIAIVPFEYDGHLVGAIELAAFHEFADLHVEFLRSAMEDVAITINIARSRDHINDLLEETTQQAQLLKEQQEELKASNEELEETTQVLRTQADEINRVNSEIEEAKEAVEKKAAELMRSNRYKSEFLANMSHELRTPLNSVLLLARRLVENKEGNLDDKQVQSAKIIHSSGYDLLALINDILDLSKIEAGHMNIALSEVSIEAVASNLQTNFQHVAQEKGLDLVIEYDADLPSVVVTDQMRLEQVVRNLTSNALKFTEKGSVSVTFSQAAKDKVPLSLTKHESVLAVSISDTGIGISKESLEHIFSAFQQAHGGIDRKFGGTGLGLSISKELTKLLGGEIKVSSEEGKGSTFTLYLPLSGQCAANDIAVAASVAPKELPQPFINGAASNSRKQEQIHQLSDDRDVIGERDRVILVIEDDPGFAQILQDMCKRKGFKTLVSATGAEGLALATKFLPAAILLDIKLPDFNGTEVLRKVKEQLDTRHIPIHIISAEDVTIKAYEMGAMGYLIKPVDEAQLEKAFSNIEKLVNKRVKDLLIIEDDDIHRQCIIDLIGNGDVSAEGVSSGEEAFEELNRKDYDCIILDLGLPDMTGFEFLSRLEKEKGASAPPPIIYTGRELSQEEVMELRAYSSSIVIKGAHSEERLFDEAALFLHRMVSRMPEESQQKIASLYDDAAILDGKKVLLVDDDMRNLFALSAVLEEKGMEVVKAENGIKALEVLGTESGFSMALIDIMMPEMDGYETMKRIRQMDGQKRLPIIALTAKAMLGDRELCIEAGANDYMSKPVEADKLLSLMRVWLSSEAISNG